MTPLSPDKPSLTILSLYVGVNSVDFVVELSLAGKVYCAILEPSDPVPSEDELIRSSKPVQVEGKAKSFISVEVSKSEYDYAAYCYGKSISDVGMSNTIESTKRLIKTKEMGASPTMFIGSVDVTYDSAVVHVMSSQAGTVWCLHSLPHTLDISKAELLESPFFTTIDSSYTETTISINSLDAATDHKVFCTCESISGIPMSTPTTKSFKLFRTADAPEHIGFIILRWAAVVVCLLFSAMFSGLNLGLMGLDLISLRMIADTNVQEIVGDQDMESKEVKELLRDKEYATKILPIRKKGNLLLCTLLIGNVMVNSLISILSSDMTGGVWGFVFSTIFITLCGEIIPQAVCSRFPLKIGSHSVGIVSVIIFILYPICIIIASVLDCCLGTELGNIYNRYQLYTMFELYKEHSSFKKDTIDTMQGALTMDTKTIQAYVRPIDKVYMLSDSQNLDYSTCAELYSQGFSRVPVYHEERSNIIGVLHMKELILINPDACMNVASVVKSFPHQILYLSNRITIGDAIKKLVNNQTELAIVTCVTGGMDSDLSTEIFGIITLEDLVRTIVSFETPLVEHSPLPEKAMSLFHNPTVASLSDSSIEILCYFVNAALKNVSLRMPNESLTTLIRHGEMIRIGKNDAPLYNYGETCDFAAIVMDGCVQAVMGEERYSVDRTPFSVLNIAALVFDHSESIMTVTAKQTPIYEFLSTTITGYRSDAVVLKLSRGSLKSLGLESKFLRATYGSNASLTKDSVQPLEMEKNCHV